MPARRSDIEAIRIGLLVSAVFNFLFAAGYLVASLAFILSIVGIVFLPCVGALAIALITLGVAELKTRDALAAAPDPAALAHRLQTLAILEVCTILLSNLASVVCGIIILTKLPALQEPEL